MAIFGKTLKKSELEERIEGLDKQILDLEAQISAAEAQLADAVAEDAVNGGNKAKALQGKIASLAEERRALAKALPAAKKRLEQEIEALEAEEARQKAEARAAALEKWAKDLTKRRAALREAIKEFFAAVKEYETFANGALPSGAVDSRTYGASAGYGIIKAHFLAKKLGEALAKPAATSDAAGSKEHLALLALRNDEKSFESYLARMVRAARARV
jgi:dsDNA-specific endonuclease/ATPase MutS2